MSEPGTSVLCRNFPGTIHNSDQRIPYLPFAKPKFKFVYVHCQGHSAIAEDSCQSVTTCRSDTMENRRASFDEYNSTCNCTSNSDDHNMAILMSFSETLSSMDNDFSRVSLSAASTDNFSTEVSTVIEKTIVPSVERGKPKIIADEILIDPCPIPRKNSFVSRIQNFGDVKSKKSDEHEEITKKSFDVENTKRGNVIPMVGDGKSKQSAGLEEITKKFFDRENIRQSNLWPALTALETSFHASDETISTDDTDIILNNLHQRFSICPRQFIATLVTIIEESFLESGEENGDVSMIGSMDFLKTTLNAGKRPKDVMRSQSGSDAKSNSWLLQLLQDDDNKWTDRPITLPSERRVHTGLTNALTEGSSCMDLDGLTVSTDSEKISKVSKTWMKIPRIIIDPASPINTTRRSINYRRNRRMVKKTHRSAFSPAKKNSARFERIADHRASSLISSPLSDDGADDEYVTAESGTDEISEISGVSETTKTEEFVKEKLNMRNLASRSWNTSSRTGERTRKVSTHAKKLEIRVITELVQKRQKCFDIVAELRDSHASDTVEPEIDHPFSSTPCEISSDFCSVLSACQEYLQCGENAREITKTQKKDSCRFATSSKKTIETEKSKRKSIGKRRNSSNKSPGARTARISPKNPKATFVDTSSIRPVSHLRRIFSPRSGTAGCSESKGQGPSRTKSRISQWNARSEKKGSVKFPPRQGPSLYRNIVSPVGEYIRGKQPARPPHP